MENIQSILHGDVSLTAPRLQRGVAGPLFLQQRYNIHSHQKLVKIS